LIKIVSRLQQILDFLHNPLFRHCESPKGGEAIQGRLRNDPFLDRHAGFRPLAPAPAKAGDDEEGLCKKSIVDAALSHLNHRDKACIAAYGHSLMTRLHKQP